MECIESILKRRTIRRFKDTPVDNEKLNLILKAAISAPSAHNEQPWDFLIINDRGKIKFLAEVLKEEYLKSGKATEKKAQSSYLSISSAPLIIVGFLNLKKLKDLSELEKILGIQSLAASAENILLASYCLGLGANWRAVPLVRPDIFRSLFNVPEHLVPQWMILIGYPDQQPKEKSINSEGIFHFNGW